MAHQSMMQDNFFSGSESFLVNTLRGFGVVLLFIIYHLLVTKNRKIYILLLILNIIMKTPYSPAPSNIQVLSKADWKPSLGTMPLFANMYLYEEYAGEVDFGPIWLTRSAVLERLEVMLHTYHQFNEVPSSPTEAYDNPTGEPFQAVMSMHINGRKQVDDQTMVHELGRWGFTFTNHDGEIAMLVDAHVPWYENTNGRTSKLSVGERRIGNMDVYGAVHIPQDESLGFRPVSEDTEYAISIPLDSILEIHNKLGAVETFYLGNASTEARDSREIHDESLPHAVAQKIYSNLQRYFRFMENDPELGKAVGLLKHRGFCYKHQDKVDKHNTARIALYTILEDLGIPMVVNGDGYFPFEPVVIFSEETPDLADFNRESLKGMLADPNEDWKFPIMLEEILNIIDGNVIYRD